MSKKTIIIILLALVWQQESSRIISFFNVLCFLFHTFAPIKMYRIDETEENSNQ